MKRIISAVLVTIFVFSSSLIANSAMMEPKSYFHFGFDTNYVFGIPAGTKASGIIKSAKQKNYNNPVVKLDNGTVVADDTIVCTGMQLVYNSTKTKTLAVYGDVDGTGAVDVADQVTMHNIILTSEDNSVSSAYLKAADMDYSGYVDVADRLFFSDFLMYGLGSISLIETEESNGHMFSPQEIQTFMEKVSYPQFSKTVTVSPNTVLNSMLSSTIFGYGGHGASRHIVLEENKSDPALSIVLSADTIYGLDNGALSDCRLAYFNACYTGWRSNGVDCFLDAVYSKGAKTVIGYSVPALTPHTNTWNHYFFQFCSLGHTIEEACLEANYAMKRLHGNINDESDAANVDVNSLINGLVVLGNKKQRLAQPLVAQNYISSFSLENSYDPMTAFETNSLTVIDDETAKGFYDLSVLREKESRLLSTAESRENDAKIALSEYVNVNEYTFDGEGYNESLGIYTLDFSKHINGIESNDVGTVMMNDNGSIVGVLTINTGIFDDMNIPTITYSQINDFVSKSTTKPYTIRGYNYGLEKGNSPVIIISVVYSDSCCDAETLYMPIDGSAEI